MDDDKIQSHVPGGLSGEPAEAPSDGRWKKNKILCLIQETVLPRYRYVRSVYLQVAQQEVLLARLPVGIGLINDKNLRHRGAASAVTAEKLY